MTKNKIIAGVVVVALVVVGVSLLLSNPSTTNNQPAPQNQENTTGTVTSPDGNIEVGITTTSPKTFTMAEVSAHNSASSCYTAVNGNVYDVTSFPTKHPGGAENILKLCGIDGSSYFNKKHGGQEKPEATLASFKIGTLAQ